MQQQHQQQLQDFSDNEGRSNIHHRVQDNNNNMNNNMNNNNINNDEEDVDNRNNNIDNNINNNINNNNVQESNTVIYQDADGNVIYYDSNNESSDFSQDDGNH